MVLTSTHDSTDQFSPPAGSDSTGSITSPSTSISTNTPETKKAHVFDVAMAEQQQQQQQQRQQYPDEISSLSVPTHSNPQFIKTHGALRRARAPPRNDRGDIYCDHPTCRASNSSQTFKRLCEWNKHMDRHERPYKCVEVGCELNPGFTYSGGLLRHQREVHRMHLSTKEPLFCPFPNCNRSSGTGFTRKENLEEHKRRRHLEEIEVSDPDHDQRRAQTHQIRATRSGAGDSTEPDSIPVSTTTSSRYEIAASTTKRRRLTTLVESEFHGHAMSSIETLKAAGRRSTNSTIFVDGPSQMIPMQSQSQIQTKTQPQPQPPMQQIQQQQQQQHLIQRLREEILRKEDLIRRQNAEISRLHNFLHSLPPQMVYDVLQVQAQAQAQVQLHIPAGEGG
ncbi:hypothetical protein A1O1_07799 [Capronia coronata CBS 617.96]|uniref:C2H2-type domain-containing protein n=1 Tax=Capronia coronata CBS 617.96 TaxID=1182541 RepID=W9YHH5_9EURO|nr:uncharacterized protein A1O1_07799 [Capronia coronata CBS 617.96]EXJ81734.1 hypothetical protein A1O1_07799 [Capronia coronata CBS 617.96]